MEIDDRDRRRLCAPTVLALDGMHEDAAAALINEINELVRSGSDVESFLGKLHRLVSLSPASVASSHQPGIELYRATKHHNAVPRRIEDLWYPPAEVAPSGRANRAGEPIFYCSSDPNCAWREIGIAVGQLAVVAKWVTTAPMVLHDLGYTDQVLKRAGSRRALPEHHRKFYESSLGGPEKMIRDFLAMSFTDPSSANYSLTTAIAEIHLRADEFSGILYPAVSKAADVDNLALRPAFVQSSMKLPWAQLVSVDEVSADGSISGEVLADLAAADGHGELRWAFRQEGTVVSPGGRHPFVAGERLRMHTAGELNIEGKRYRIEAGYSIESTELGEVTVRDLRGIPVDPLL